MSAAERNIEGTKKALQGEITMLNFLDEAKKQNKFDLQKAMADNEKAASYPQRLFSHLLSKLKCTDGEREWLQSQFTEMLTDALEEAAEISYHNTLNATAEIARQIIEDKKIQKDEKNECA